MTHDIDSERLAAIHGGQKGGEYLDSIGVFDLRELDHEQFQQFCFIVCAFYHERYIEQGLHDVSKIDNGSPAWIA